jgi:hypothetical protein
MNPLEFEKCGCLLLRRAVTEPQLTSIAQQLEHILTDSNAGILRSRGQAFGVRNLLQLWPELVEIVRLPPLREFAEQILGQEFGVVRALLFDKPPGRSWTLPWHRDRTIAVKSTDGQLGDFANPTRKAGVPHLNAPSWLLCEMLTLRLSIDPMTAENGPLVVVPGSHHVGADTDDDLTGSQQAHIETILCDAGDVFAMRPLLAHSSLCSAPTTELRRRVVHIELCGRRRLPCDLQWNEFAEV